MGKTPHLSLVIPVYNEEHDLPQLFVKLRDALGPLDHEVIFVNDGSRDGSFNVLRETSSTEPRFKALDFRRNFGQSAAINTGIQHVGGEVIVIMDSDLENDPADIPALLARSDEGFDVVSGWRRDR